MQGCVPCIASDDFSRESGFWRKISLPFLSSTRGRFSTGMNQSANVVPRKSNGGLTGEGMLVRHVSVER